MGKGGWSGLGIFLGGGGRGGVRRCPGGVSRGNLVQHLGKGPGVFLGLPDINGEEGLLIGGLLLVVLELSNGLFLGQNVLLEALDLLGELFLVSLGLA